MVCNLGGEIFERFLKLTCNAEGGWSAEKSSEFGGGDARVRSLVTASHWLEGQCPVRKDCHRAAIDHGLVVSQPRVGEGRGAGGDGLARPQKRTLTENDFIARLHFPAHFNIDAESN